MNNPLKLPLLLMWIAWMVSWVYSFVALPLDWIQGLLYLMSMVLVVWSFLLTSMAAQEAKELEVSV